MSNGQEPASADRIAVGVVRAAAEVARRIEAILVEDMGVVRFAVRHFADLDEAIEAARGGGIDAVLLGLDDDRGSGLEAFDTLQREMPCVPILVVEAAGDSEQGFEAVRRGARDFLSEEELDRFRLEKSIRCALVHHGRRVRATKDVDLFNNLLENIPERIYFKDLESRFIRVNRAMAEAFHLEDPQAMIGKDDFDFFTKEHAQPAFDDERLLITEQAPTIQKVEKETFADGRVRWALTTKMPLRSTNGRIVGTFGISHDITKLRQMEEALERERNQLRITSEELTRRNAQMVSDLAMAREIQLALLPRRYPVFPPRCEESDSLLHFDSRYIPAQTVGGDFFTIFSVSPSKAGVFIADVMGHGPRAALVTAILRMLCEELQPYAAEPGEFVRRLNLGLKRVLRRVEDPMLCTGFYMTVDSEVGTVEFSNAGHPSPIHLDRSRKRAVFLSDLDPRHGPALGLLEDAAFPCCRFTLQPTDLLLLFTDGLFEVRCDDDEEYGTENLLRQITANCVLKTARLLDTTLTEVMGNARAGFEDDVCLVGVERRQPARG